MEPLNRSTDVRGLDDKHAETGARGGVRPVPIVQPFQPPSE